MSGRLGWLWSLLRRRLWFRASLFGLGAVGAALLAAAAPGLLPDGLVRFAVGAPVDELLTIVASSMLAVTTFSLGTMVTAFGAATSNATPRAARILIDDPISQNVLSTFIGAFVFAIVGLIAASIGLYGEEGRAVLLVATVIVIGVVIATLFGWVDYLANLSRLGAVVEKLEARAAELLGERARAPHLGAAPPADPPPDATPIRIARTGYIAHIDLARLDALAEEHHGAVHVALGPGGLVDPMRTVAYAAWPADAETRAALADCFNIDSERSLDQDPRHALIVLSEVASRALSPGVNDPGTAIGVIGRQQRLLTDWVRDAGRGRARDLSARAPARARPAGAGRGRAGTARAGRRGDGRGRPAAAEDAAGARQPGPRRHRRGRGGTVATRARPGRGGADPARRPRAARRGCWRRRGGGGHLRRPGRRAIVTRTQLGVLSSP